jgi:hypothetical protein
MRMLNKRVDSRDENVKGILRLGLRKWAEVLSQKGPP